MSRRILTLSLCLPIALGPWPASLIADSDGQSLRSRGGVATMLPGVVDTPGPVAPPMSEDAVVFRQQIEQLLDDMEHVNKLILEHPLIGNRAFAARLDLQDANVRMDGIRETLQELDGDDLLVLRDVLQQFPGLLAVPGEIEAGLEASAASLTTAGDDASACPGSDDLEESIFERKFAMHILTQVKITTDTLGKQFGTSPGDPTHATALVSLVFITATGITEILIEGMNGLNVIDEQTLQEREECLGALCEADSNSAGRTKGCDGADNDCDDLIDELDEDQFPPEVTIERSVTSECYPTAESAEAAVARLSRATDDCHAASLAPPASELAGCDAVVQAPAIDSAGNVGSDAVTVVVDGLAPDVSCSVVTTVLSTADNAMHDVGLSIGATDNCDGTPAIEVEVSSDEPTATALGGSDAAPDAELLFDGSGVPTGLLLRAQASSQGAGDGRVYRIRIIATDRCGNSGQAECLVGVPLVPWGNATNSGQMFDASEVN